MKFNPSLYLVTDRGLCNGRPLEAVVARALAAGVTLVQYRDKHSDDGEFVEQGKKLRRLTERAGVALIINDRYLLVDEIGADGVHIGQEDARVAEVRDAIGDGRILGVSVFNAAQARAATEHGANYLAANGVFVTATKTDLPGELGLAGLVEIARATHLPVVAIGGINTINTADIITAGAAGVAVVSAICSAEDIEGTVGQFITGIRQGIATRS